MSCGHAFVFEVCIGNCHHDYTGELVGMGSLGLARGGRVEISLDRVLWFCYEIFVLGLFRHPHLIGCLAYYLVVELFHVEKYRQTAIIAIGDTKRFIILLRASINQFTTCTRKLHIVVHMNLR